MRFYQPQLIIIRARNRRYDFRRTYSQTKLWRSTQSGLDGSFRRTVLRLWHIYSLYHNPAGIRGRCRNPQETFVQKHIKRLEIRSHRTFAPWLFTMLERQMHRSLRALKDFPAQHSTLDTHDSSASPPESLTPRPAELLGATRRTPASLGRRSPYPFQSQFDGLVALRRGHECRGNGQGSSSPQPYIKVLLFAHAKRLPRNLSQLAHPRYHLKPCLTHRTSVR